MTYYSDLSPYCYLTGSEIPQVLNVGWLDGEHAFERRPMGSDEDLSALIVSSLPLSVVAQTRGFHICELCGDSMWNAPVAVGERQFVLGSAECWFPGENGIVYAAPTLIPHYLREHCYRPPAVFDAAVRKFVGSEAKPNMKELFKLLTGDVY